MASAEFSVVTPERVSLQYDIAGLGSRGAAVIIDSAIQATTLVVVLIGLSGAMAILGRIDTGINVLLPLLIVVVFAISNGYFMLFEILWSGQTPGKRMVGVRVIRESGYPLRTIDAVIRNVIRMVDWLPFLYGVGIVVMLCNGRSRRLGDFASGTLVVREAGRGPGAQHATEWDGQGGPTLSPSDATLVRDFLVRRESLNVAARADLAQRMASAVAQRYRVLLDEDPERFLERLPT